MAPSRELQEKILNLWKDPKFSGAFSGLSKLQTCLKLDKKIDVSQNDLRNILLNEPSYVMHKLSRKRFPRRSYKEVNSYGALFQADLAEFFECNFQGKTYKYVLVVVDVASRKMFARPLTNKKASNVFKAFEDIFKEANIVPEELETDQGSEFISKDSKSFFKKNNIFFKVKTGSNKASIAEHSILLLKRKLYIMMRTFYEDNWVTRLPDAIKILNNSPLFGSLRPADVKSKADDPKLFKAKMEFQNDVDNLSWKDWQRNQTAYEKNKANKLQKNVFVYLTYERKTFDKANDLQRAQLYQIARVDARKKPILYYLKDLKGRQLPSSYYAQQIEYAKPPNFKEDLFAIEKVFKPAIWKKGRKYYKVKFLGYSSKFNQLIPAKAKLINIQVM